jgi:hypothetical protein
MELASIHKDDTVRLVHQTVAEFFLKPPQAEAMLNPSGSSEPKPRRWNFELSKLHQWLGAACLTYLTCTWRPKDPLKVDGSNQFADHRLECEEGLQDTLAQNPFLEYGHIT